MQSIKRFTTNNSIYKVSFPSVHYFLSEQFYTLYNPYLYVGRIERNLNNLNVNTQTKVYYNHSQFITPKEKDALQNTDILILPKELNLEHHNKLFNQDIGKKKYDEYSNNRFMMPCLEMNWSKPNETLTTSKKYNIYAIYLGRNMLITLPEYEAKYKPIHYTKMVEKHNNYGLRIIEKVLDCNIYMLDDKDTLKR